MIEEGVKAARDNYRVMVIENTSNELTPYALKLAEHFDITFASSLEKAHDSLNSGELPDIVLSDITMSSDNG